MDEVKKKKGKQKTKEVVFGRSARVGDVSRSKKALGSLRNA